METLFRCAKCAAVYPLDPRWCPSCGTFRSCYVDWERQADRQWGAGTKSASAEELVGTVSRSFVSPAYPTMKCGPRSVVGVFGAPGSGKSTFATKWADAILGPVCYFAQEEGHGDALIQRLKRLEICRADFHVAYAATIDDINAEVSARAPLAVVFDSLSVMTLGVRDLQRAADRENFPIMVTLQVTKSGAAAGSASILHGCDVVIECAGMKWACRKNRFSGLVGGDI